MIRTRSLSRLLPLLALLPVAMPAGASALRWEPAANGAAIVLPVPAVGEGIVGGTLSCARQEWRLRLRAERPIAGGEAKLAVGGTALTLPARLAAGTVEIALPAEAVSLLKDGADVAITLGEGGTAPRALFPLAGSRMAIEAVAPLCSPPDVPGFEAVRLAPAGAAVDAAKAPTAEEAALFREATGKEPALAAGFAPADGGRSLLFASLCGSNRYYGASGCKLMGFSRESAGGEWKPTFESEGMHLFRDPRTAHDGWPDLATLPLSGGGEELRWSWDGQAYRPRDEAPAMAGGAPSLIDELRTGGTKQ